MIKFIRSYVRFKVKKGDGNNLINITKNNGILVWDIKKIDNIIFANCFKDDYLRASREAKKQNIRLKLVKKTGFLFIFERYKKRLGLFIGLLFLISTVLFVQNFIWELNLNVVGENTTGITIQDFSRFGIKQGAFLPSLKVKAIENSIYNKYANISWISINVIGTKVNIELRPRVVSPPLVTDKKPCNIVAKRAGKIVSIQFKYGQKQVKVGEYVSEGELLVSGVIQNPDMSTSIIYTAAKIMAHTEITNQIKIEKNQFSVALVKQLEEKFEKSLSDTKILAKKTTMKNDNKYIIINTNYTLEENIAKEKEILIFS